VLEAMAMAKAVVVTPPSAAVLSARPGVELEVAGTSDEFAAKVVGLLDVARAGVMGGLARSFVLSGHTWASSFEQLDALLERGITLPRVDYAGAGTRRGQWAVPAG
jgi:hypothetical protein